MSKTNELKWGSALSYLQMIASVIIGIVYTPTMIQMLGKSEYGLYNTVTSTIAVLSVLSLGFNASYVRFFSKYRQQDDKDKIYRLNGLFLLIFLAIGLIALLCGLFLVTHLEMVFKDGLTADEYQLARILMLLVTFRMALSFPMSVFSTIIMSNERFIFQKLISMLGSVVEPLVNIPLLLLGFRSVGLVIVSFCFSMIADGASIYYVFRKLQNRFLFAPFEKGLFKALFNFTIFIAINMVVDQINNNIDNVLLARYCGTAAVSIYAVGASLYKHYVQISLAISGVFTPRIHRIYNADTNEGERDQALTELFVRIGRLQFILLALIASGYIFFGRAFLRFWVGEGFDESYYVGLLLMLPATVPLIQNIGIEIQRAANKQKFRSIAYLIMAVCNLILTIFLCQKYGAIGAAVGTSISLVLANGFIMNIYYYRKLNLDIPLFWKNILRLAIGMIPAFVFGFLILRFVEIPNVLVMLVCIAGYTVVFLVSSWKISMNAFEKNLVLDAFAKVFRRERRKIHD